MSRFHQVVLISSLLPLSWLGMMAVHEAGHLVAAWLTGGKVVRVVLYPLTISRTDVDPNPHPLAVTWAGPAVGALLPLAAFAAARLARMSGTYLLRFFAGFCLIANGAYLGVGAFDPVGDAGKLLQHGARAWQLAAFGLPTPPGARPRWACSCGMARGRTSALARRGEECSPPPRTCAWCSFCAW